MKKNEFQVSNLVRENIRRMKAYSSARSLYISGTLMDANENPYDPFQTKDHISLNRYPDGSYPLLRKKLGAIFNIEPDLVSVGNGSDEIIDLLIRIFCEPRLDEICICVPTFGMYRVAAELNDVKVIEVPLVDYDLNVDAILNTCTVNTKILFLCNPNNPTGTIYSSNKILQLVNELNCIVVVDEAYGEFSDIPSLTPDLRKHPNLVILKTLSKAYAMAGARLGIALASEEITKLLKKVKMPYNISVPTMHAVLDALDKHEKILPLAAELIQRRKLLEKSLLAMDFVQLILPSHANFLCVKFIDAEQVFTGMLKKNIIIRRLSGPWLEGFIRISVGTEEENTLLVHALEEIGKQGNTIKK